MKAYSPTLYTIKKTKRSSDETSQGQYWAYPSKCRLGQVQTKVEEIGRKTLNVLPRLGLTIKVSTTSLQVSTVIRYHCKTELLVQSFMTRNTSLLTIKETNSERHAFISVMQNLVSVHQLDNQ